MRLSLGAVFYVIALIIFVVVAIGVKLGTNIDLTALGFAALAAGLILDGRR